MTKINQYTRSYQIDHQANATKVELVAQMSQVWRSAMTACKQDKINALKTGDRIRRFTRDEWVVFKPAQYGLSARQAKSVENQVNASLKAWQEKTIQAGRRLINQWVKEQRLDDERTHQLRRMNKRGDWWNQNFPTQLRNQLLNASKFPVFKTTTMVLDDLIAPVHQSKNSQFEAWISMRVLDGKVVDIPLNASEYYKSKMSQGTEGAVTQVQVRDGRMTLRRCIARPISSEREEGRIISLDWGLCTMFTTDEGHQLGQRIYPWLKNRTHYFDQRVATSQHPPFLK